MSCAERVRKDCIAVNAVVSFWYMSAESAAVQSLNFGGFFGLSPDDGFWKMYVSIYTQVRTHDTRIHAWNHESVCVCVCVRACVRAYMRVCMRACVHACVRVGRCGAGCVCISTYR